VSETNSSETVAKSGNGCKWLQMTVNSWELLEMTGNDWEWLEMVKNGCQRVGLTVTKGNIDCTRGLN
jgi:hypothetical protein